MRKTWWHYSHSRLSVSYIALYALTTVYIWTPDKCIIESYFLFQHIYLIELVYLLDSPWWDSWLWVSCDLPGSRLCPDCGSSAGHPARPWPLVTVTSLEKAKCPQIFTDRASGLNGFHWIIIVHPVFIASIPLITSPCPRHDRSITELSIAIITDQIRKISNQSFYFPSDRMCQACETDGWYRGTVHFVMYC